MAFVSDTFADVDGTLLTAHTGQTGATWTLQSGTGSVAIKSNQAVGTATGPLSYYASGTPGSADYTVQATLDYNSNLGVNAGIGARLSSTAWTGYLFLYDDGGGGRWILYKIVTGSLTQLGVSAATLTAGQSYVMSLNVTGSTITCSVGGAAVITVTDTSITAAGFAGVWFNEAATGTTGIGLKNFTATGAVLTAGTASLSSVTASQIVVTCGAAADGTAPYTYQWYRSTTPNFTPGAGNILTGATTLTYTDTTPVFGTDYYYILVVTDNASATAQSNQIAGTLLSATQSYGFIGDSITLGLNLSAGQDPPSQFGVLWKKWKKQETVNVSNRGVTGSKTADWISGSTNLTNAKTAFAAMIPVPTYILVMLGTNDAAAHVTAATYFSNLQSLCTDLTGAGYKVVLSYPIYTPSGANSGATDQAATALCLAYQAQIDALINGSTILRGDVLGYGYYMNNLSELQADQTHPTATGALSLATLWAYPLDRIVYPTGGGIVNRAQIVQNIGTY